jgi:hypothetical protein
MDHLEAELGIDFKDSTFSRGHRPVLGEKDYLLRIAILIAQLIITALSLVARIPLVWIPLRLAVGFLDRVFGFLEEVGIID